MADRKTLRDDALETERKRRRRAYLMIASLAVLVVLTFCFCISVGSTKIPLDRVISVLIGAPSKWSERMIILDIRMPEALAAAIVGAALSVGGMAMQALFKNPMASPSVLGVSSGASFGAALFIAYGAALGIGAWGTILSSFGFAILTLFLVYLLAYNRAGGIQTTMLLLAGMAISALFSGMTSMVEFFSDADTVSAIVFWSLGGFDRVGMSEIRIMIIPIILGVLLIAVNARALNLLTAGESKARALGVNVPRVRLMLLLGAALVVAGSVAFCGVIGFVGLIVPHAFRALVGPEHKRLIPICILGGAVFMMLVDVFARSAMTPYILPIGTITSILGAPFFLWILRSRKNAVWRS